MNDFIVSEAQGAISLIRLNRPHILNAWHAEMRSMLVDAIEAAETDANIGALVLTGAGERAFCAGQDLNETKTFNPDRAEEWIKEWELLYGLIRSLSKPLVIALNGVAAGSGFQVALLGFPDRASWRDDGAAGDQRRHRQHHRTVDHARDVGVGADDRSDADRAADGRGGMSRDRADQPAGAGGAGVPEAMALADELAAKPPVAMRLNKARFREVTEAGFRDCIAAGIRNQREAYATGSRRG